MADRLTRVSPKKLNGSAFVGYFIVPYSELVRVLGEPHSGLSMDGKVKAEWRFSFRGVLFSVYDYKNPLPVDQVTRWHVGGFTSAACLPVASFLGVEVVRPSRP